MVIIVKIYTCGLYVKPQSSNPCRDHRCQGNGYRHRDLDTRVGTIEVAVPKLRAGSYDDTITELPVHHSGGLHLFRVAELTTVRESHRPVDSHAAHGHPSVVGHELPQSGPSLNGIGSRDVPKGGRPRCWPGRCAADRPPLVIRRCLATNPAPSTDSSSTTRTPRPTSVASSLHAAPGSSQ